MPGAVLLWRGAALYVVRDGTARPVRIPGDPEAIGRSIAGDSPLRWEGPPPTNATLARGETVAIETARLAPIVRAWGGVPAPADVLEARAAWARVPPSRPELDRRVALSAARTALDRALRDPTEVLITLAREEERLERALGREGNARVEWEGIDVPLLQSYAAGAEHFYAGFAHHHAELEGALEEAARALAPTLSDLVGSKVAARLIAQSGGLVGLTKIPASRLQLLGARRRPSHGHGPRFGLLYRANRMDEVPLARRGAYARSLAALAVIAARLDLAHRAGPVGAALVARRDRRITDLQRRNS